MTFHNKEQQIAPDFLDIYIKLTKANTNKLSDSN